MSIETAVLSCSFLEGDGKQEIDKKSSSQEGVLTLALNRPGFRGGRLV